MILKFDELDWIMDFFDNGIELRIEGIDRVRNFSFLWNLFETYACNKRASITTISLAVDKINQVETIKFELLREYIEYFRDRYISQDGSQNEIFKGLKFRSTEKIAEQEVIDTLVGTRKAPVDSLKSLLYIVYRLRNNLFHGEKNIIKLNN